MTGHPVPRSVVLVICMLLLATATVMALGSLALAADGSYYLVRVLGTESVFGPDARVVGNALRQAPVLLAARSGLTDTYLLSLLLGLGQLVLPAAAWSLAIVLSRASVHVFAAVAMTAGLCAGSMWFFSVSEAALAIPLTVVVAVLLGRPSAWRWSHAALATGAAIVLVATYESALVTGTVLAVWAAWRAATSISRPDRLGGAAVAALSVASVLVALAGTTTGSGPTSARSSLYFIASYDPWQFYVALVAIGAVVAALAARVGRLARTLVVASGGAVAAVAVYGMPATSVAAFQARGGAAIAGLALVLFLWSLWVRERTRSPSRTAEDATAGWLVLVPVVFVGAAVLANVQGLSRWSQSLDSFRTEVDRAQGIVRVDEVLPSDRRQVVWTWTSSSLSLIVRGDAEAGILFDPRPSYLPFPPSAAREQLPDRYAWHR